MMLGQAPDYTFNGRSAQYATAPILVGVPVGGGAVFEVRRAEPGDYPFVSHAFADATKGAMGVLRAR
jgi:hypothetical protein